MKSNQSSLSGDYNLPRLTEAPASPSSRPQTGSSTVNPSSQYTFLYTHQLQSNVPAFNCEELPSSGQVSPTPSSPVKYESATVISPPRQLNSRSLEFSSSPSPLSSLPTSRTPPCSSYFPSCSPIHSPLYQHHIDQVPDAIQQQYSTQLTLYREFQDNREHFFHTNESSDSNNGSSKHIINTNSTCLNLHRELISDLRDPHRLPYEADLNNNNSNICDLIVGHNQSFFGSSTTSSSDIRNKCIRLPPFEALLSNSSAKQRVLESPNQSIIRTNANMFDDNDEHLNNSLSSMEDETHYTDLTNVSQTVHDHDQTYVDEAMDLNGLSWSSYPDYDLKSEPSEVYDSDDIFNMPTNISFPDTQEDFIMDPPTPDSDGYESSSAERISSNHWLPTVNTHEMSLHVCGPNEPTQLFPGYNGHDSSSSDEGYSEGTGLEDILPDFSKLQNLDKVSQRKRSSVISAKEKKKIIRESQTYGGKERRKPGRKPGQVSNVLHLWEFMRDLLQNSANQGIIEWISKSDGVFRVMNSTEVARLWGEKKKNKKQMTYEKLSRSLRYSRLEGYFADLPRDKNYPKKLCFKFGPKSRNWH